MKELMDSAPNIYQKILIRRIHELLNESWIKVKIPELQETALIIPIHKDDDPFDMDNYRGISIITDLLKILTSILNTRLKNAALKHNLIRKEQAGFRSKEECMAQVISLYEIVNRRKLTGRETFACFIDFRKAYDTVPHEALFLKLERMGIRGRILEFIRALYNQSFQAVRIGAGSNKLIGEQFQLLRGLRQECPLSPILFNLFINDILDNCGTWAVRVPFQQTPPPDYYAQTTWLFYQTLPKVLKNWSRK
jgi:hypothetical protein